jgi:outer membrane protein assembly factor BamB
MYRPLLAFLVVFAVVSAQAADWPQYMGPDRIGVSPEEGIARTWPEGGPRVLWSHPLGEGFGGPAIRDSEVYVLDRETDTQDILRCYDLETGKLKWTYGYDAPGEVSYDGSRTVPTVTEKFVYSVGMTGHFSCVNRETQEPVWNYSLVEEFPPQKRPKWGYAQSPFIEGDLVIIAPQAEADFVAAFNRFTGDLVWSCESLGGLGFSSPVVLTLAGVRQVVMNSAGPTGGVTGLSLEDGAVLWRYDDWNCKIPIPFATALPSDRLFITGEYGAGSRILQIKKAGDGLAVEETAVLDDAESQIHQPIIVGDHLYMNSNGNSRRDGMICMTLDGEIKWRTRDVDGAPWFERGGFILVDGLFVSLDGKEGTLHLIEPSPEAYTELARAEVFDGSKIWAPMAFSDGKLVLRNQTEMKCLDLRNP